MVKAAPIAPVRTTYIVLEQGVDMVLQVSTCVYARWEWWMHGKEGVCVCDVRIDVRIDV